MTNKSEWQEANRRLTGEERRKLGDPPTAEEMLAYSRGELSEHEQERIRELLVAYPELARMYAACFPAEGDAVPEEEVMAGWTELQRRLGVDGVAGSSGVPGSQPGTRRAESPSLQRGAERFVFRHYVPTTIAAAFALVFFALFVQAESRARSHERALLQPRIVGAAQELEPGGRRGAAAPTMLRNDGEEYLLKPRLFGRVRHPHYSLELQDESGTVLWTNHSAQPGEDDAFQITIPHGFLRPGTAYRLLVFGLNGDTRAEVATYDIAVPAE
jgi:hypothetical protein